MKTTLYTELLSTNGAVSLVRTDLPGLPPFAVLLADGELLDTFADVEEAREFADDAMSHLRNRLPWPDPDAPAVSDICPEFLVKWVMDKVHAEPIPALLPCGCYADECDCGQYPDELGEAMEAMVANF